MNLSPRDLRFRDRQRERERVRKRKPTKKAPVKLRKLEGATYSFDKMTVKFDGFTLPAIDGELSGSRSIAEVVRKRLLEQTRERFGFEWRPLVETPPPLPVSEQLKLLPFRFDVHHFEDTGANVVLQAKVHDVTGKGNDFITFTLPISPSLRGQARAMRVRKLLAWALLHELNECLRFDDGTPVVEPHPERYTGARNHPDMERMGREARR